MSAHYRYLNTPHESETHHTTVHSDIYQLIPCERAPWLYLFMAFNCAMSVAFYLGLYASKSCRVKLFNTTFLTFKCLLSI